MDDQEKIIEVQNNEGKGNPYHKPAGTPEGGQFTSGAEAGAVEKKKQSFSEILAKKKACEDFLANNAGVFDKAKVDKLTVSQKYDLVGAYKYLQGKEEDINKAVQPFNQEAFSDLWLYDVYPSDYKEKQETGAFNKKLAYFEKDYYNEDKDEKIAAMMAFKAAGEKYQEEYAKAAEKWAPVEEKVNKYKVDEDAYSESRKQNATWIVASSKYAEMQQCKAKWQKESLDYIYSLPTNSQNQVKQYTGSYHSVNELLRGGTYYSTGNPLTEGQGANWANKIGYIDAAIDGHTYNEDIYLRRGITKLRVMNIGGIGKNIDSYSSEAEINSLIGTTFKDQGFLSCGTSAHTGFTNEPIEMKIYCPKGTNMLYVEGFSHYSDSHENETIIARGYNFKITNAYKKGEQVVIECDVILDSNKDRYNKQDLQQIAIHKYK